MMKLKKWHRGHLRRFNSIWAMIDRIWYMITEFNTVFKNIQFQQVEPCAVEPCANYQAGIYTCIVRLPTGG